MTTYPNTQAWLEAFRLAPDMRLDRLLRCGDSISPLQRGEPHDAALMALRTHGGPADVAMADTALAHWLEARLTEPLDVVVRRGWNAYVACVMDGFALAARMPGEVTGSLLRNRFEDFDAWTIGLSDEGPGDLRARFLLALAHNQGGTRRFLGLWYRLCDGAGRGALGKLYFTVGLTGLRGLPPDADGRPPVAENIEGLCRWARHLPATEEARERFLLQWHALMGRHPRKPETWPSIAAAPMETYAGKPFVAWWQDDLDVEAEERALAGSVQAPSLEEQDNLLKRLPKLGSDELEHDVTVFAERHTRYATSSNDRRFIHKALNVVGNKLLELGTTPALHLAARLATLALDHVTNNENNWVLWAQALQGLGQRDIAECILWQATHRLQNSAPVRTVLAKMLADAGRMDEAEALYRGTMARFANNAYAYNALANLLTDCGRATEAETLYRETMDRFADNPICRLNLGLLLIKLGRSGEALPLLAWLESRNDRRANTLRARLEGRIPALTRAQAEGRSAPAEAPAPDMAPLVTAGRAVWASFILSHALDRKNFVLMTPDRVRELREMARHLLAEALVRAPSNPVVQLIARRYGVDGTVPLAADQVRQVAGRNFALRMELALQDRDENAFAWLEEDFPDADRRALTACAWLHRSPSAKGHPDARKAAEHLCQWLSKPRQAGTSDSLGFLHAELARWLHRFLGGKVDFFVSGFGMLHPETVGHLIDIALLGLVLEEAPPVLYETAFAS